LQAKQKPGLSSAQNEKLRSERVMVPLENIAVPLMFGASGADYETVDCYCFI
jgi:hypothetical protein